MFNKLLVVLPLTLSLASAVDEFSSERLLGIEVGYATVNAKGHDNYIHAKSNAEFGVRLGAQNKEWRTTVRVNSLNVEGRNYQKAMLDFDHFVWDSLYKTDSIIFKPYLGAHIGWLRYTDVEDVSANGLAYGGQLGMSWNVLNEVDFDLAYRYTTTSTDGVEDMSSVVFGVNYLY